MRCVATDGKCDWKNNKYDPTLSLAFKLARELQLTVDELFYTIVESKDEMGFTRKGILKMKDLAITQEYLICAVNSKGKISGFSTEKLVCLIASGLLELQLEDCIKIDKKRVTVTNDLPDEKLYLKPLYDFVNQQKPVKLEKILAAYTYSFTDKNLHELIDSIGASLDDLGLVETTRTGIFGNKNAYVPNANAVHYVVDMIRAEFLEDVEVTEDIAFVDRSFG